MNDTEWTQLFADRQQLAVARLIAIPTLVAITRSPRECETLRFTGLWRRDDTGPSGRPEHARLRTTAILRVARRDVPVDVELAPWSERATELVLHPTTRRPRAWSGRRRARWYAAAHAAVDELRTRIVTDALASSEPRKPLREPVPSTHRFSA